MWFLYLSWVMVTTWYVLLCPPFGCTVRSLRGYSGVSYCSITSSAQLYNLAE